MLLTVIKGEFVFNCQCRKLSDKTVKNYSKQIGFVVAGDAIIAPFGFYYHSAIRKFCNTKKAALFKRNGLAVLAYA